MKVACARGPSDKMAGPHLRWLDRGSPMRMLTALLLVLAGATQAQAAGKARGGKRAPAARSAPVEPRPGPAPAETRAEPRAFGEVAEPGPAETRATEAKPSSGKAPKAKVYTFTGLDVEGKLKTPQLLYFLNRVRLELDTTGRERRSFLKELEQTSDDKGL